MLYGEKLEELLDAKVKKDNIGMGLEGFCSLLRFKDKAMQSELFNKISKKCDIIWYPGCGGDLFPCEVFGSELSEKFDLKGAEDRIYLYIDPDSYGLCEEAFANQKFYNRSISNDMLVENYNVTEIRIQLNNRSKVEGYYCNFVLAGKKIDIIFLKMQMTDFLRSVIDRFKLPIRCLFYINMESKGGNLFPLYNQYDIEYPQYLCANRIEKFNINRYAELQIMQDDVMVGTFIKREEESVRNQTFLEANTENHTSSVESTAQSIEWNEGDDLPFD